MSVMLAFLGWATDFMERCRESAVFSGLWFKISVVLFIISFVLAGMILYVSRFYRKDLRVRMMWMEHRILLISGIACPLLCVGVFTISLIPPYGQACLVFGACALLFIVNLGCLLLYD